MKSLSKLAASLLVLSPTGCVQLLDGDSYQTVHVERHTCASNEVLVGGACVTVGVVDCGAHFVADGQGACSTKSATDCADGQSAPTAESCGRVGSECPATADPQQLLDSEELAPGDWYVWAAAPAQGNGSAAYPFQKITEALAVAKKGDTVVVSEGTYTSALTIYPGTTVRGVCPGFAHISGAVTIMGKAGSEEQVQLSDLQLSGAGLIVYGADAVMKNLWIHDTSGAGIDLSTPPLKEAEAPNATLDAVLVDTTLGSGIVARGYALDLTEVHIRDVTPLAAQHRPGRGLEVMPVRNVFGSSQAFLGGALSMKRSMIERASGAGLVLSGSGGVIEDVIVRDTSLAVVDDLGLPPEGYGVVVEADVGRAIEVPPGSVSMERVIVENTHGAAIRVDHASLTLESSTVRNVSPVTQTTCAGHGLRAVTSRLFDDAEVTISDSAFIGLTQTGIHSLGMDLSISGTIIRNVAQSTCGGLGDGVALYGHPNSVVADISPAMVLKSVRLASAARAGALAVAGDIEATEAFVTDTPVAFWEAEYDARQSTSAANGVIQLAESQVCASGDVIETCQRRNQYADPGLFAWDEDGPIVDQIQAFGSTMATNGTLSPGLVTVLGHDEIPPSHGGATTASWKNAFFPPDLPLTLAFRTTSFMGRIGFGGPWQEGVGVAASEHVLVRAQQLIGLSKSLGKLVDFGVGLLYVRLIQQTQDGLVGIEGATIALEDPASSLTFYRSGAQFVAPELQNVTSSSGDAMIALVPLGTATVLATLPAGSEVVCKAGTGNPSAGLSAEDNSARVPIVPGVLIGVELRCQ